MTCLCEAWIVGRVSIEPQQSLDDSVDGALFIPSTGLTAWKGSEFEVNQLVDDRQPHVIEHRRVRKLVIRGIQHPNDGGLLRFVPLDRSLASWAPDRCGEPSPPKSANPRA